MLCQSYKADEWGNVTACTNQGREMIVRGRYLKEHRIFICDECKQRNEGQYSPNVEGPQIEYLDIPVQV